jgi:hypothetical protein
MTANDYGESEEAAFKHSLVHVLSGYIQDTGGITETSAIDFFDTAADSRRLQGSDDSMVQIKFTLAVDMGQVGYDSSGTDDLVWDISTDLTTVISDGTFASALSSNSDTTSPLSAANVAVNESTVSIALTEVTGVTSTSSDQSNDDSNTEDGFAS